MSYLTLDADRLVREAVDAFLVGRLRPNPLPDTLYATKNSRYRIIAGLVHEASDTSLMGAELVAWLFEQSGSARILPLWQFGARAIFVDSKSKHVVVTSRVTAKSVVSEARPARIGGIPAPPPIPSLKNAPSVAPPALVSLGGNDPAPSRGRPDFGSDEDITKVDHTSIADADEVARLRATSKELISAAELQKRAAEKEARERILRSAAAPVAAAPTEEEAPATEKNRKPTTDDTPDLRSDENRDGEREDSGNHEVVEVSTSDVHLQGEAVRVIQAAAQNPAIITARDSDAPPTPAPVSVSSLTAGARALPPPNPPPRRR